MYSPHLYICATADPGSGRPDLVRNRLRAPAETTPPLVHSRLPDDAAEAHLELLLVELAHDIRNPLVTIKTFAHYPRALAEDRELRHRFAALTHDAVRQIDRLLENLLTFARLGHPRPNTVPLATLLGRAVTDAGPETKGRDIRLRVPHGARCTADPSHLRFAFRNILAGVAREVPPRAQVGIDASAYGIVILRFPGGGEADQLRRLTPFTGEATLGDRGRLPLALHLARAALERNGGALVLAAAPDETRTVVVHLPIANEPPPLAADAPLELLLVEIARELRRPFVKLKAFARQLPALLEDATLRMRLAAPADDAVTRMDHVLQNTLADRYTRRILAERHRHVGVWAHPHDASVG